MSLRLRINTKGLAVVIPSGMGKTTLSNKFPSLFLDIDDIVWKKHKILIGIINKAFAWKFGSDLTKNILRRKWLWNDTLSRKVLLCHSPDQLPSGVRVLCILNSNSLNVNKIKKERKADNVRISLQNRHSLWENYRDEENYFEVQSNKVMLDTIINCLIKYVDFEKPNDNTKLLVPSKDYIGKFVRKERYLRYKVKYDISEPIVMSVREYMMIKDYWRDLYVHRKWFKIESYGKDEKHSLTDESVNDQIVTKILPLIDKETLFVLKEYRWDRMITNLMGIKNSELVTNWMYTPAYLGGVGIQLDGLRKPMSYITSSESIITPFVKYPKSERVENLTDMILKRSKFSVVDNIQVYEGSQSTNKIFKSVGILRFHKVIDNINFRKFEWMISGVDFCKSMIRGVELPIKMIRPIFNSNIRINQHAQTIWINGLMRAKDEEITNEILSELFVNVSEIIDKRRNFSKIFWRDWLCGRLEYQKPINMWINDNIVSTYFIINLNRLLSLNCNVDYGMLKSMCKIIEKTELNNIIRYLRERKITLM
ncbi:putative coat protein [Rhizophagus sp. RF1 medium virus]|nr:putative coat protein [Rhizophagus sp. RF1 medium virus]